MEPPPDDRARRLYVGPWRVDLVRRSGVQRLLSDRALARAVAAALEPAIEQAEAGRGGQTGDVRWSAADELRLLVTHGTLHLCGRDHATPDEEASMRALERTLLQGTG